MNPPLLPLVLALFLSATSRATGLPAAEESEDWANSPEAYFLTSEERREWKEIQSRENRQAFIDRYWLKRDPTPGTGKNEFRELVLARIKTADARFPIAKTPGSRTKRGMVFIVFGTPARVNDSLPVAPSNPRAPQPGTIGSPVGFTEGTESTSVWIYDRERTPRLLEALGDRPSLEISFVVEPSRRRDEIQAPGLVDEYREILARRSIVNPDLVPAARAESRGVAKGPAQTHAALSPDVQKILESAGAAPRGQDGSVLGTAVLWGAGDPATHVWFYVPGTDEPITLHGRIRNRKGEEIATVSEPAATSSSLSVGGTGGRIVLKSFSLPAGDYDASFAVEGRRMRTAASASIRVPNLTEAFAVSSLVLSGKPAESEPSVSDPFVIGNLRLSPRADAVFLRSESLWFFLEIAGVADPKTVMLETRLRRGTEQVADPRPSPVGMVKIAPSRYVCGFELPLKTLAAGDYVLYVTVRGENVPPVLRRGDFQLRESTPPA